MGTKGKEAGLVTVSCRSWEGFCEMMYILFVREKQELHNGKSGTWVDGGAGAVRRRHGGLEPAECS